MVDRPGRPNSKLKLASTLLKSSIHQHSYVEGSLVLNNAWNFVTEQLTQKCPLTWSIKYDSDSRTVILLLHSLHFSITHYKVSSLYSTSSLTTYSYVHMGSLWSESVKKDDSLKFKKTKPSLVKVWLSQREWIIL